MHSFFIFYCDFEEHSIRFYNASLVNTQKFHIAIYHRKFELQFLSFYVNIPPYDLMYSIFIYNTKSDKTKNDLMGFHTKQHA